MVGIYMEQKSQFWKTKTLKEMTKTEWESLCDNCGSCCQYGVRFLKTDKIKLIAVACQYLDISTCRCLIYKDRFNTVPDCLMLSPNNTRRLKRLPYTCAYRALVEGRELEWWHPLVSGDPNTVHEAGISMQGKIVTGVNVHPDDIEYFSSGNNY
jgi:uncharacterized cysteine cluster protein YcgN (CxxCxxCC family)